LGAFVARGPETESPPAPTSDNDPKLKTTGKGNDFDFEACHAISHEQASYDVVMAQLMGVAVLEFGTVLNRHVFLHHVSF
jgi:hypothetical protein